MKVAALDLGSNTFLCLIAEVAATDGKNFEITKVYFDSVEMVRLGEKVGSTGAFQPEALVRADRALKIFSEKIKEHQPERVLAGATAAARNVKNPEKLFELCEKYKIPLKIISGDDEARLTYKGGVSSFPQSRGSNLIIDIGGGSTEVILGVGSDSITGKSLPMGCVKLSEKWKMPSDDVPSRASIEGLKNQIRDELNALNSLSDFGQINSSTVGIAVAGTPTELARIQSGLAQSKADFDPKKIEECVLDEKVLADWAEKFEKLSPPEIVEKYNVHPKRADVILSGIYILQETLKKFNLKEWKVSARGIRYGLAQLLGEQK